MSEPLADHGYFVEANFMAHGKFMPALFPLWPKSLDCIARALSAVEFHDVVVGSVAVKKRGDGIERVCFEF